MHRTVGAVMFVLVCLHFVYVIATQRIYTLIEEKRVPPPPVVINSGAFCPMEKSGSCKENDTRAPVGSIENYCGVFVCAYCTLRLLSTSTVCCVHCTVYIKHSLHPTKSSPFYQ